MTTNVPRQFVIIGIVAAYIGIIVGFASSVAAQVMETKTLDRFYDPIELKAELFPQLHNLSLDHLRLMTCKDGKLNIIPYQFAEWTSEGAKGQLILRYGPENNAKKANNKLDSQDQLLFMARDSGDRVKQETWKEIASDGVEIEVTDPVTQKRAWAYLLYFQENAPSVEFKPKIRLESTTPELRYYGATFTLFGDHRDIGKKHYRTVMNKMISTSPEAGGNGKNFIDRSKFRASVSLLFGAIKIKTDEDSFIGEISSYDLGPVRGHCTQWISVVLPLNLRSPRMYTSVYAYDTAFIIPTQTHVPLNPGYVLNNYQMSLGYDLAEPNGRGMKYYSSTNPKGYLVDGHMDADELKNYNDAPDDWRCIIGSQGWMMNRSLWDVYYRKQADIRMKYIDDVNHYSPPETYPGDLGYYYTQSTIKSLEPRDYFFQLEWYFPYQLYTPNGPDMKVIKDICNIRDYPLEIKVGNRRTKNTGAILKPMRPL